LTTPNDNPRKRFLTALTSVAASAMALGASGGGGGGGDGDGFLTLSSLRADLPPEDLLSQLKALGVRNATADHKLTLESASELGELLSAKPERPEPVFESNAITDAGILVVHAITDEVLSSLAREPTLMHQLDPRKFEEFVARLLERQGCEVTLTKRTRDGGYDILGRTKAGAASLTFVAECKRYAPHNRVGVEIIRGVYGVTELHRANYGLVVTSSSFSRDAKQETLRIGPRMQLAEYTDVCQWLQGS